MFLTVEDALPLALGRRVYEKEVRDVNTARYPGTVRWDLLKCWCSSSIELELEGERRRSLGRRSIAANICETNSLLSVDFDGVRVGHIMLVLTA